LNKNGRNIILFGPPGVGKGAQAGFLSHKYQLGLLSTGDAIRDEISRGTEAGLRVKEAVEAGSFADDKTVLNIVLSRIDQPSFQQGFVIDGFPRTVGQAVEFDRLLLDRDRHVDYAIFIVAPESVVLQRLGGRLICSGCGRTYHKQFHRPRLDGICDVCKDPIVSRHDDHPDVHKERLRTYHEKTAPLADYYLGREKLREINGDQTIGEVAAEIGRTINGG
jgi:adenylate kinase